MAQQPSSLAANAIERRQTGGQQKVELWAAKYLSVALSILFHLYIPGEITVETGLNDKDLGISSHSSLILLNS